MELNNVNEALEIFEESCIKQAEATESGNYKIGNKYYDKLIKAARFLREENAIGSLQEYLSSPFIGVRLWSAYYLLPIKENKAISVLDEIANGSGIHSFTAKITLDEWKKGSLRT